MIKVIPMEYDYIFGINISNKLEKNDIQLLATVTEEKLKSYDQLRMYVEVENFRGTTPSGVLEDFKFGCRYRNVYYKKVIVCKELWLGMLTVFASKTVYTNMDIKHFYWQEKDQALEWIKN
ncbi:MAG: STAS/SEC14 domain-containing protein [Moorea sp. SIO3G5]|nr:STAS/SEC14 domain-containing protein [Moorena sp. SIO3G5]